MDDVTFARPHWSFWIIGLAAGVFSAMGCINFIAQLDVGTVEAMPEPFRTAIGTRPVWATAAFAVAVFGGVLGAVLMLLRQSAATYVFAAATLGALLTVAQFAVATGMAAPGSVAAGLVHAGVMAAMTWYARRADRLHWTR